MGDEHESPLRRLMADADGAQYRSFDSLEEAKADVAGAVILEADDGGQIYAAFPAAMVACTEDVLSLLLADLDRLRWDDPTMRRLVYERRPVGAGVAGGMGGGVVEADGWVHPEFVELGMAEEIRSVVRGERDRISKHP